MKRIHVISLLIACMQISVCTEKKVAFITGITGQDGAYLAELLLKKGYEVHGLRRRSSVMNTARIDKLYKKYNKKSDVPTFILHDGDMCDGINLTEILKTIRPDEIYNLAAQSHVGTSFAVPEYTANVDALGALRILESIRILGLKTKYYQASTSELFGLKPDADPQDEETEFHPRSPYAVAKLYAFWITNNYREAYNIYAVNGILFNHESPLRGDNFVTKKIASGVARISCGKQSTVSLGNLNAKRDWGHAKDYVKAMWLMLQQDVPQDFVIATGETHSVREFVELAFKTVGITIAWKGSGLDEVGYDVATNKPLVCIDPQFIRPSDVEFLLGNPTKAKTVLGWQPTITFEELVKEMVEYEVQLLNEL